MADEHTADFAGVFVFVEHLAILRIGTWQGGHKDGRDAAGPATRLPFAILATLLPQGSSIGRDARRFDPPNCKLGHRSSPVGFSPNHRGGTANS